MKFNIFDLNHDGQMSKLEQRLQMLITEVVRLLFLGLPGLYLIMADLPQFMAQYDAAGVLFVSKTMIGHFILIALCSHYVRRILSPYVDMRKFAARAYETPLGASIVYLSLSLVIASMYIAAAILIK